MACTCTCTCTCTCETCTSCLPCLCCTCLCFSQAMQRELDYLELAHQLRGRLTAQRLALQRTDKLAKAVQQRLDALRGARYAPGFT